MTNGYIKLYRSSQDNPLYFSEPFTKWQAWVDLLLLANHKTNTIFIRGHAVTIKRGQVLAGERFLAKRWKWSRGKVRRFLHFLGPDTAHQIVPQTDHVCTLITICNYDTYQGSGTTDGPQTVPVTEPQVGPQTVPQTDLLKKDKNKRRIRKIFMKPTEQEVSAYAKEHGYPAFNAMRFIAHYDSCGWLVGKDKPMKDWKGAVRVWLSNEKNHVSQASLSQKEKRPTLKEVSRRG